MVVFICFNLLNADNSEELFYKNKLDIPKGWGIHTDVGYGSYLVELHSSEIDSAIDYTVLEYTLGSSYVYGKWMCGLYGKFLLDERNSNMHLAESKKKLGNKAEIEKNEFALYGNYTFLESIESQWRLNLVYRKSFLYAENSYVSFHNYGSSFKYDTSGLAFSLVYGRIVNKKNNFFINGGVLYTEANIQIDESINNKIQDTSIDTKSHALGGKLALGYNYNISKNLIFNLRTDTWLLNFDKLIVKSKVGDQLPNASLKEQSFSSYIGITWHY